MRRAVIDAIFAVYFYEMSVFPFITILAIDFFLKRDCVERTADIYVSNIATEYYNFVLLKSHKVTKAF